MQGVSSVEGTLFLFAEKIYWRVSYCTWHSHYRQQSFWRNDKPYECYNSRQRAKYRRALRSSIALG